MVSMSRSAPASWRICSVAAMISGPMPSPCATVIGVRVAMSCVGEKGQIYTIAWVKQVLANMELIFEIRDAEEGGYCARALGHAIFTEADTWEALRANVLEAVSLHFEDAPARSRLVQMHYVKDELIPLEAA